MLTTADVMQFIHYVQWGPRPLSIPLRVERFGIQSWSEASRLRRFIS